MNLFHKPYHELGSLEACANRMGGLHRFHPALKVITALIFVICVVSCDRVDFFRLVPFVILFLILHGFARIPIGLLWRRLIIALPFSVFAGIWGCFLDTQAMVTWFGVPISGGMLTLFSILLKTLLCVGIILILVGTTTMRNLSIGLKSIHCPKEMIILFELTVRYLDVIIDEAIRMKTAYQLRGGSRRGISIKHFGSFVAGLLFRSFSRAQRIYHAMSCRGYPGNVQKKIPAPELWEILLTTAFVGLCLLFRLVPVIQWINIVCV